MTENRTQSPEMEFVPLSLEQAELLAADPEAIRGLGHVAMSEVEMVGVVPATENSPAHFVNLSADIGTRINVTSETGKAQENYARYGSPDVAADRLYGSQETAEDQESTTLAGAAEQAGFKSVLRRYNDLEAMIRDDNRANDENLTNIKDDLNMLHRVLDEAAHSGPWAGNYLRNYPELIARIEAMAGSMDEQVNQMQPRIESREQETVRYTQDINTVGTEVGRSIAVSKRSKYDDALGQVSATLQNIGATAGGRAAINSMKADVIEELSRVRGNHNLTVGDASDLVQQLMARFSAAEAQLLDTRAMTLLGEQINTLDKLLMEEA